METTVDSSQNPASFLQIGDLVAGSFFFSSFALLIVALFMAFQIQSIASNWRTPYILAILIPFIAALNSFYRRNYWVITQTSPVEFRFFDWFLTVPLMAVVFYYMLKSRGAKLPMFVGLLIFSMWMLGFGYLGEAVYPENSALWGVAGSIGFAGIIGIIMGGGYPKIFGKDVNPYLRKGYLVLSIMLPIGWSVYPLGYMTVPGNILEGQLSENFVYVMYNFADVFNKAGLALGVYWIASRISRSQEEELLAAELQKMSSNNIYTKKIPTSLKDA
ncbi:MAG: bacteriorhodopsin [Bacteroidota bacterium]